MWPRHKHCLTKAQLDLGISIPTHKSTLIWALAVAHTHNVSVCFRHGHTSITIYMLMFLGEVPVQMTCFHLSVYNIPAIFTSCYALQNGLSRRYLPHKKSDTLSIFLVFLHFLILKLFVLSTDLFLLNSIFPTYDITPLYEDVEILPSYTVPSGIVYTSHCVDPNTLKQL